MTTLVNIRTLSGATGGQQRVTQELVLRMPGLIPVAPQSASLGKKGHLWEQIVLPFLARGRLLWSPSGTGPLLVGHQVATLHDAAPFDVPECFSPSFTWFYQFLLPRLARRVKRVVTVSQFSKERLCYHLRLPSDQIIVIPNGVSGHFSPSPPEDIEKVRHHFNLPQRYWLVAASADRRKNFSAVISAWRESVKELPQDLHLIAFGNLKRTHVFGEHGLGALEAERFSHIGFVQDAQIVPLISGAQGFLFPSLYEGFGLPILEAMACGIPVLTSDRGAMKEVAGDAALLVDPASQKSLIEGFLRFSRDETLKKTLIERGLDQFKRYSWDDAARAYEGLFEELRAR
jgi:glycosyltransferase involved in cell wall biosynthesis